MNKTLASIYESDQYATLEQKINKFFDELNINQVQSQDLLQTHY